MISIDSDVMDEFLNRAMFLLKTVNLGLHVSFYRFNTSSRIFEKLVVFKSKISILGGYFVHRISVQGGHRVKNSWCMAFSVVTFFIKIGVQGDYNVIDFYDYV